MRALRLLPLLLLLVLPSALVCAGPVRDDVIAYACHVYADEASGSGTLVEVKGKVYVLTAAHVVERHLATRREVTGPDGRKHTVEDRRGRPVRVEVRDGTEFQAVPVFYVPEAGNDSGWWFQGFRGAQWDLCLLEPVDPPKGLKGAVLWEGEPEEGQECAYCGFGDAVKWNLQLSHVNQYTGRYLMFNGGGYYGHSGSGLFLKGKDGRYKLAGVIVLLASQGPKAPLLAERQISAFLRAFSD